MGGVVANNTYVLPCITSYLNITTEEFHTFSGENIKKLINGRITTDKFWNSFSKRFGKKIEEELFCKFFNPILNQEMINLIKWLKNSSRVVCGTNVIDPHYYYHLNYGHYDIFDYVYASNKIGLSKPDPAFYKYILRCEEIKPEHTIFIDDNKEHVLSAKKIGIKSILFKNLSSLRNQMELLG